MIEHERRGDIAWLRLHHGKANTLDLELLEALASALDKEAESSARGVVITGSRHIFSAGVDLRRLLAEPPSYLDTFLPALDRVFRIALFLPKPVVAAVNGHAIAGGCVLACTCDRRLAARGPGRIGVTELLVGLPFPAVALEALRAVLPPSRLSEAVLTGRTWPLDEAAAIGFVDEVVPADALDERAQIAAEALASIPASSFALAKRHLRQPLRDALEVHGNTIDAEVARIWGSGAARAAVAAYAERTLGQRS
ncbi:MAG: enoyl-CoA hydratase/isomerase family protein [Candidatus Rokuibacteriota bacterium]|nr:MAG: enoyl-CoA hydratase/isomerase family protein [Candidatus Rokubacteria bacterium]